jgi:hypothetical protein
MERTATAIIARDVFKPHALDSLLPTVSEIERSRWCRAEALHSATIIRLWQAENALAARYRNAIDARLSSLESAIRHSLTCARSDPFLWMTLASLDGARKGTQPQQLTYLRVSYLVGPKVGRSTTQSLRSGDVPTLPLILADADVREFARLMQSWIHLESLAIFKGSGWPIRDRLLASLQDIGLSQREAFYIELYTEDDNVVVPGVKPRDPRPWY